MELSERKIKFLTRDTSTKKINGRYYIYLQLYILHNDNVKNMIILTK